MAEPKWMAEARKLVGLKEIVGSKHEPKVVKFFAEAGHSWVKDDETAWCAAFVNAMLKRAGIEGTGKLNARSFLDWGENLDKPKIGCIVVFSRGDPNGWQGHVGFYAGGNQTHIRVLGGNQSNAVNISSYPKSRLLGYRWPAAMVEVKPETPPADGMHKVKAGETWWGIAKRYGLTVKELIRLNDASENDVLKIGRLIRVSASHRTVPPSLPIPTPDEKSDRDKGQVSDKAARNGIIATIIIALGAGAGALWSKWCEVIGLFCQ